MSHSQQGGPPSVEVPTVQLDEKSLMEEAMKNTGLSDFGEESFLEGFRRLLDSLEKEARLSPIGRLIAHAWCSATSRTGSASPRIGSATPRWGRRRS
jgi:hypothetical protein